MSRRERWFMVLGIAGAILLVAYPLAYRIASGDPGEAHRAIDVNAIQLPTPTPDATPTPSPSTAATASPEASPAIDVTWAADALRHRHLDGQRFDYSCTPNGIEAPIWGTDVYTDASVCTAAVHAGWITFAGGGTVTISILPGAAAYRGTLQNGVSSHWLGTTEGAFEIVGAR